MMEYGRVHQGSFMQRLLVTRLSTDPEYCAGVMTDAYYGIAFIAQTVVVSDLVIIS